MVVVRGSSISLGFITWSEKKRTMAIPSVFCGNLVLTKLAKINQQSNQLHIIEHIWNWLAIRHDFWVLRIAGEKKFILLVIKSSWICNLVLIGIGKNVNNVRKYRLAWAVAFWILHFYPYSKIIIVVIIVNRGLMLTEILQFKSQNVIFQCDSIILFNMYFFSVSLTSF